MQEASGVAQACGEGTARPASGAEGRYAAGFGASLATWHFLTGPPDEVGRLLRALGVVTGSGGAVGHSTVVLFVDGEGRIAERSTDIDLDPERVVPKIRRLLG